MTDYQRMINGILIDSQYLIPAISNKNGFAIKAYCDVEIAKVTDNVIPYKIETENGNVAGFFTLQTNGSITTLYQKQLRPAFVQFDIELNQLISNFINTNRWINDTLL